MRIILALFAILIVRPAMADSNFKNKSMTAVDLSNYVKSFVSTQKAKAAPPVSTKQNLQPIRQGQLKSEVFRIEVVRLPDGSYNVSQTSQCIRTVPTNVYDLRGTTGVWTDGPTISCPADLGGQPAVVNVTGDVLLNEGKVFSDEAVNGIKTGFARMSVTDYAAAVKQWGAESVAARGLSTNSLIGSMGDFGYLSCTTNGSGVNICTPVPGVYYSARFEFVD